MVSLSSSATSYLYRMNYITEYCLLFHVCSGISIVSMQRLPVNGLNLELLQALGKTFDDLEKNKSRGMILTSVRNTFSIRFF